MGMRPLNMKFNKQDRSKLTILSRTQTLKSCDAGLSPPPFNTFTSRCCHTFKNNNLIRCNVMLFIVTVLFLLFELSAPLIMFHFPLQSFKVLCISLYSSIQTAQSHSVKILMRFTLTQANDFTLKRLQLFISLIRGAPLSRCTPALAPSRDSVPLKLLCTGY